MERLFAKLAFAAALAASAPLCGQTIEFEAGGLHYLTLSRQGLTMMCALLPQHVREYAVLQVAFTNGSPSNRTVRPEDFVFQREDGTQVRATPARKVVSDFLSRGGRNDVVYLVSVYESGLYGINKFKSTNGYEQRRQQFLAEVSNTKLKAAATASAIVLVATRVQAGESTDGAVFFPTQGRPLGAGKLIATVGSERFEFELGGLKHPGELKTRQ